MDCGLTAAVPGAGLHGLRLRFVDRRHQVQATGARRQVRERLLRLCSAQLSLTRRLGARSVNEVAFHPEEPILGSCSSDRSVYLGEIDRKWDTSGAGLGGLKGDKLN